MKKLNVLQAWRAIFIILICIAHMALRNKIALLGAGGEGVAFFIILSGFLTGYNYQTKEINCSYESSKEFLIKKLKKFYPLHIVAIILSVILQILCLIKNSSLQINRLLNIFIKAILNASFLQVYIPIDGWYMNEIHGVGWFLSMIVFCYANSLLGLKIIEKAKKSNRAIELFGMTLLIHCIIVTVLKDTQLHHFVLTVFPPFRYLEYFMAMIVGYFYNNISQSIKLKNRGMWSIIETFTVINFIVNHIILKSGFYSKNGNYHYYTMFVCAMLIVFVFSLEKGGISKILDNKYLVKIGNVSFYIYIMHQVIIKYVYAVIGLNNIGAAISAIILVIYTVLALRYYNAISDKLFKSVK